jgi:hypothetical protein
VIVTPGVAKFVCTPEPYFPARRQPVCPELSELTSFCTVKNGLPTVPPLLSDPDVEATRSHVTAADADDEAAANTAVIENRSRASVAATRAARRPAAEKHFRWLIGIMGHWSTPMTDRRPKTGHPGHMTDRSFEPTSESRRPAIRRSPSSPTSTWLPQFGRGSRPRIRPILESRRRKPATLGAHRAASGCVLGLDDAGAVSRSPAVCLTGGGACCSRHRGSTAF